MTELDRLRELLDEIGVAYLNRSSDITIGYYTDPHTLTEAMDGTLQMTGLTAEQVMRAIGYERETCKAVYSPNGVYCSVCHGGGLTIPRRGVNALRDYCPNCGRKIDGRKAAESQKSD